jgi:hypothetical protein
VPSAFAAAAIEARTTSSTGSASSAGNGALRPPARPPAHPSTPSAPTRMRFVRLPQRLHSARLRCSSLHIEKLMPTAAMPVIPPPPDKLDGAADRSTGTVPRQTSQGSLHSSFFRRDMGGILGVTRGGDAGEVRAAVVWMRARRRCALHGHAGFDSGGLRCTSLVSSMFSRSAPASLACDLCSFTAA